MKWLLLLLLLAGCAKADDGRETVRFWAMGREGEVVAELIPEFERLNPGIKVELQQIPWSAAHEKLLTAFAGRVTPDIAQLGSSWVPELVALGALEPLDGLLKQSLAVTPQDYFPGGWSGNVIGGRTWGIPWYADTRILFYRRDLLSAAGYDTVPSDWPGWVKAMRAVKARAAPRDYAIFLPINEYEPLLALALQQPEPLLRGDGRFGNFRSTGFVRASDFYLDLFRQGLAPRATNTQISNIYDEFAKGHFAFVITGPWNIGEFKRRLPADRQDDWMTAPLPGPTGPGLSIAGGSSLAVFAQSERKAAAWKLIEFLSQPKVQLRFFELTGDLPPRRSAWDAAVLAGDPYAKAFREQLERTRPPPAVPEWERIGQQMRTVSERAVAGQVTAAKFRATLDADTDDILEKRRWKMAREARQ
ncbi:sugar ABC transporter substrate-binding protein [Sphingomonas sp.]|uniref:sugar ABC transporter substrate-binding protein n=1 Tax=Sphingomonas sp. TaxID=28214 RepID=UPI00286E91C8|nr:sugar ABC transporter substrate-binding protein [Sphingomonas sp.]